MNKALIRKLQNIAIEMIIDTKSFLESKTGQLCKATMSELAMCKERCTIKMSLPRIMGNTTLAIKIASSLNLNVLCLTYSQSIINCRWEMKPRPLVCSWNKYEKYFGNRFDVIIIDMSSLMSKRKLEKIYQDFGHDLVYFLTG